MRFLGEMEVREREAGGKKLKTRGGSGTGGRKSKLGRRPTKPGLDNIFCRRKRTQAALRETDEARESSG